MEKEVLRKAFGLIAKGLIEKEELLKKEPNRYPHSPCLQRGINQFLAASVELGHVGEQIWSYADETAFFARFMELPVAEWFSDWEPEAVAKLNLAEEPFYGFGALGIWEDENRCIPSEDCLEYLESQDSDILNGTVERVLYGKMKALSQEHYMLIRRFIIEHPVATIQELRDIKKSLIGFPDAIDTISFAYETWDGEAYRCPACGWTMQEGRHGLFCHSRHCLDITPDLSDSDRLTNEEGIFLRLKKGVMRYVAQPGKLELEIADFCERQGLECILWPMMDTYDVEIRFPDDELWEIDAKAYRNPIALRNKIQDDPAFSGAGFDRGYYVVPVELTRGLKNYTAIVNRGLHKGAKCITSYKLKQEIRRKVAQMNEEA